MGKKQSSREQEHSLSQRSPMNREYNVSQGVQKEHANRTFPTNIHNSTTKMKVEEDTEKLKRRKERFSSPLPILKNVVADTSMEIENTHFKKRV